MIFCSLSFSPPLNLSFKDYFSYHKINCDTQNPRFKKYSCNCEWEWFRWVETQTAEPHTRGKYDFLIKENEMYFFCEPVNELILMGEAFKNISLQNEVVKGETLTGLKFSTKNLIEIYLV